MRGERDLLRGRGITSSSLSSSLKFSHGSESVPLMMAVYERERRERETYCVDEA